MPYQVYHILPRSARGQSAARCGKKPVQLWQSVRYIHWFFKSRNRQTFSYFFSIFSIFKRYLIKQKPPKTDDFQQFREVSFYILNNNILLIIIYRYFCAFFTHYCILSGYLKLLFIREIIKSITPRLNHTFRWGFNKAIESVNIIICWCGKSYCSYCPKNCINYIMD